MVVIRVSPYNDCAVKIERAHPAALAAVEQLWSWSGESVAADIATAKHGMDGLRHIRRKSSGSFLRQVDYVAKALVYVLVRGP